VGLVVAFVMWLLMLFALARATTCVLHPCREAVVDLRSFATLLWCEYLVVQITAQAFTLPFINGSICAALWYRGMGADTAMDVLWLAGAAYDAPLISVRSGAIIDTDRLLSHFTRGDGCLVFKRSILGQGAVLEPGALVLAGQIGAGATVTIGSHAHLISDVPCEVLVHGNPAKVLPLPTAKV